MTTNSSSTLINFFQSPNHSSLLHYLRSILINPTSPLLMNGLCPWLWAPTLPQRWKTTIRLSLCVHHFEFTHLLTIPIDRARLRRNCRLVIPLECSPWNLKKGIGAGLNWVRIPIGFWAIEAINDEPFLVGTSWSYFLKAWAILKLAFHGGRTQQLTSSFFQYSVGKEIRPTYISRSSCTSWKSKWLGESSNFWQAINLPLRCRIIPERVSICFLTFVEGAWNWRLLSLPLFSRWFSKFVSASRCNFFSTICSLITGKTYLFSLTMSAMTI